MARPTRRPGESSPQGLYQLGVQGRKTGATLKDDGKRDSQGMMPTAGLFSSPGGNTTQNVAVAPTEEPIPEATPTRDRNEDTSAPMDIASSGGAGPATVLRDPRNLKIPVPKGRSPARTNASLLSSPAKRNPNISPMLPPPADPAARFLDFPTPSRRSQGSRRPSTAEIPSSDSINALAGQAGEMGDTTPAQLDLRRVNEFVPRHRPPVSAKSLSAKARGKQRAVSSRSPPQFPEEPTVHVPDLPEPEPEPGMWPEPEPEPASEPEPGFGFEPLQYSSSLPAPTRETSITAPSPRPPTQKRPTPALSTTSSTARHPRNDVDDRRDAAKRQRQTGSEVSRRSEQPVKRGRGRPPKNGVARRGRGRPRRSEVESEEEGESLMTLQRGPPMPKSRGLVSMRRDAAAAAHNRHQGNDGDWWANIHNDDSTYQHERSRGQALALQTTTRSHRQPAAAAIADVEADLEDWEVDPGSLTGEIVLWEPEHEHNPPGPDDPVQVTDERIALTADAIQTYEIRDSDARYGKPLTTPFMGAGIVDLPPHSEKRPKNSRKMHLVFFVHYGKVTVNINDAQFRISAGGMWFVPRGNYYNIANEFDFPARVHFAQACEVSTSPQAVDDMTQTILA
ncbi:cupin domain-containing protein [Cordyceps fumosorosea ARSEF 2679]|uniref:CENP-C homolog n=1 Tax=Cordyceps fumosorosea (strain ARSEF 2679) TaxID=1081104 RepID=A0A167S565_CORFA|nr:cupin domain-containing protein [Cordyceps fumosorosea ARSEF 2679]OAA59265.1 cupin domain-containing protein [Cordyceps fumosorosea ARSEF 2679]